MQHDFRFISKNDPKVKRAYRDILDMHSRTIFAITVHEICQKSGFYEDEK